MDRRLDTALVIIGHGSTSNPDSSDPTRHLAAAIRAHAIFDEVHCCFWKEDPSISEVLQHVTAPNIYLVPNFISEGYFTQRVIPRELALEGAVTRRGHQTIYYCEPVGNHSSMTSLLLQRAAEMAHEIPLKTISLLLVAHGTPLHDNSAQAAKTQAALLAAKGLYAEVLSAYMEETPRIEDWHTMTSQRHVVVIPFFISDGLHSTQDIPLLLGLGKTTALASSRSEIFKNHPYQLRGKHLFYGRAIGTDPMMEKVILDQLQTFDLKHSLHAPPLFHR
jgi:sirohydrochlorin cobaltochelatase